MSEQRLLPNQGDLNGSHPELDALEQQFAAQNAVDGAPEADAPAVTVTTEQDRAQNVADALGAVDAAHNNTPVTLEEDKNQPPVDLFARVAGFAADPKRQFAAGADIKKATGWTFQKGLEAGFNSYDDLEKAALKWKAEQDEREATAGRLEARQAAADEHAAAWTATANAERAARAATNDRVQKLSYKAKLEAGGEIALKRNPGLADRIREGVIAQVKDEGLSAGHLEPSRVQVVVDENAVARQSSLVEALKAHDKAMLLGAKKAEEAEPLPVRDEADIRLLMVAGFTADEVKRITNELETDLFRNGMSVSDVQEFLAGTITKDEYDMRKADIQGLVDGYGFTHNEARELTTAQKYDLRDGDVKPSDVKKLLRGEISQDEYDDRKNKHIQRKLSQIVAGLGGAAAAGAGSGDGARASAGTDPDNEPDADDGEGRDDIQLNWTDRAKHLFGEAPGRAANWLRNKFTRENADGDRELRRGRTAVAALGVVALAGATYALSRYGFTPNSVGGSGSIALDQAPLPDIQVDHGAIDAAADAANNAGGAAVEQGQAAADAAGSAGSAAAEQSQAAADVASQLQTTTVEITPDHSSIWSSVEDMLSANGLRHDDVAVDYVKDYIMQSNGLSPEAATNLQAGWNTSVPPEVLAKLNELPTE